MLWWVLGILGIHWRIQTQVIGPLGPSQETLQAASTLAPGQRTESCHWIANPTPSGFHVLPALLSHEDHEEKPSDSHISVTFIPIIACLQDSVSSTMTREEYLISQHITYQVYKNAKVLFIINR